VKQVVFPSIGVDVEKGDRHRDRMYALNAESEISYCKWNVTGNKTACIIGSEKRMK
jgi:hypothetical protein